MADGRCPSCLTVLPKSSEREMHEPAARNRETSQDELHAPIPPIVAPLPTLPVAAPSPPVPACVPPALPAEHGRRSVSGTSAFEVAWAAIRIVGGLAAMLVPIFVGGPASIASFAIGGWLVGGGGYDLYKLYNK